MVSVAFSSAFHDASAGRDSLNFHTFELALKDVDGDTSDAADPAEQRAGLAEPSKPARRGSVFMVATPPATPEAAADSLEGEQRIHHQQQQQQQQQAEPPPPPPPPPSSSSTGKRAAAMYRQTSAHRLFRAAPPEPKRQQWKVCEKTPLAGDETASTSAAAAPMSGEDSRLRSSSWHASDNSRRSPPPPPGLEYGHNNNKNDRFFPKRIVCRDDREVLDGSDVLQQISNLTSTEPSNEREVFVGGLRESEDAVHITEEELATYFAKFGVIESVSINRDDRTQRGRGFAFVKFFQEAAALNAVVADASTHVIRGTTVSVQWSRGAKDAGSGGDRPRRRHSATSNSSSGNGSSPSNGSGRSCARLGMFPHKGGGGRAGGGGGGGGGGAGACGVGCSNGFSPMRSRGAGHSIHGPSAGGGGVPYGYGGGRHGEHHNQPMVCVVVPAQRAAALGLAPHPPHGLHSTGKCTSRGTAPCDGHFSSLAQSSAASGGGGGGGGGGHPGYASHTRSHSQPISHGGGSGGGGGGGYGHHGGSPHGNFDHHHGGAAAGTPHHLSVSPSHHVSPSSSHHFSPSSGHHISPTSGHRVSPGAGRSYGGPPAMHMPPMPRERQGRAEPRDYPSGASGGGGGGGGGGSSPSFGEYERSSQSESHLHSAYALPEWGYDDAGGSGAGRAGGGAMATAHGVVRSQSPPPMVRSRNGGGAPRPPSASPRAYDGHYSSTRYNGRGGVEGFSVAGIGGASGGVATRRRSESSAMVGRSSIQQDALAAAASYYYAVDDMGKDDAAYSRDCRGGGGGGSHGPASRVS